MFTVFLTGFNSFLIILLRNSPGVLVRLFRLVSSIFCSCIVSNAAEDKDEVSYESPASRVAINPSLAMSTVTSPFRATDVATSRIDVSFSPSFSMIRKANPFGVIGVAASYIAMYTSPSFAMLAMVRKAPADLEDDHNSENDVLKSLSLLYSQLGCTPLSIEASFGRGTSTDSGEDFIISQLNQDSISRVSVSSFASFGSSVSFNLSVDGYSGVSYGSIYSNGEPMGIDLDPINYYRDEVEEEEDDRVSIFSLGLGGDDSQQNYVFTLQRPAEAVLQVCNNTSKFLHKPIVT